MSHHIRKKDTRPQRECIQCKLKLMVLAGSKIKLWVFCEEKRSVSEEHIYISLCVQLPVSMETLRQIITKINFHQWPIRGCCTSGTQPWPQGEQTETDCEFITDVSCRGRVESLRQRHSLQVPLTLYIQLCDQLTWCIVGKVTSHQTKSKVCTSHTLCLQYKHTIY